jgi:hypothetical protein
MCPVRTGWLNLQKKLTVISMTNRQKRGKIIDILKDMASLREQRKLCRSFPSYFFNEKMRKKIVKSIERTKNQEIKKVMSDSYFKIHKEVSQASDTQSIKETTLISFHWGYGLSSWHFFENRRRQKVMRNSVMEFQQGLGQIKGILEMCKKNNFLTNEGQEAGYITMTAKGNDFIEFNGLFNEFLRKNAETKEFLLGIIAAFLGSAGIYTAWIIGLAIYHHYT